MNFPAQGLRPEARPVLEWPVLDEDQQGAFGRVLSGLVTALNQLDAPPSARRRAAGYDPAASMQRNRSSRVLFLSGARGTGKTTVLTTLINAFGEVKLAGFPAELERVRNRIVWLETLDMEPSPRSLNLLPAVLARIEAAMEGLELDVESGREYRGLLDPAPEYQEALLNLQRLQTQIAVSWQGNLEARASQLDPDSYAAEVMRVERARLAVNRHFGDVLDQLAAGTPRRGGISDPLFVLPIDDVDLSPSTCLALLQLLRSISVPRLFTVILGDLSVVEAILHLQLSHQMAAAAGAAAGTDLLALPGPEIAAISGDLAARALRKLLPPEQRIDLGGMGLERALNFRPLDAPPRSLPLHGILECFTLQMHDRYCSELRQWNTVRSLLLVAPLSNGGWENIPQPARNADLSINKEAVVYSGLQALSTSPRRLADLWLSLHETFQGEPAPSARGNESRSSWEKAAPVLRGFVRDTLLEERALLPETRREVAQAVKGDTSTDWQLRALPLRARTQVDAGRVVQAVEVGMREAGQAQVRCRRFLGWRLETTGVEAGHALSAEGAATLILFHDLLALGGNPTAFVSPLLGENHELQSWAVTEWKTGGETVALPWPMPAFSSFWELDLFLQDWNEVFHLGQGSTSDAPSESVLALAITRWIWSGSCLVVGELLEMPNYWDAVYSVLSHFGENSYKYMVLLGPRFRDWLISIALLMMPEMALPIEIGPIPDWFFHFCNQHQEAAEIRQRRHQRLLEISRVSPELAAELAQARLPPPFGDVHRPTAFIPKAERRPKPRSLSSGEQDS